MNDDLLLTSCAAEIQAASDQAKPASIAALAYSGGILVIGGRRFVIELDNMSSPAAVPLLVDHENQVAAIVGSVRPAKKDGQLYIEGTIARGTAAGDHVIALSQAGVELGISIGIEPEFKTHIAPGQTVRANGRSFTADEAGLVLVSKSNLKEISIVPVGADRSAVARIAASANHEKGSNMTFQEFLAARGYQDETILTRELKAGLLGSYEAEHKLDDAARFARIEAVCRDHAAIIGKAGERCETLRAAAYRGAIAPAALEAGFISIERDMAKVDALRAERPQAPEICSGGPGGAKSETILAAASLCYFGRDKLAEKAFGAPATEAAKALGLRTIHDLSRYALHLAGRDMPLGDQGTLKAAFSTTSLPTVLGDSAGKIARAAFDEQAASWRSWCDVIPVSDFKQKTLLRVGHSTGLEETGPGGELHHAVLKESTANVQAATYGKILSVPRQLLVNDDLGLIPQVAAEFGRMAARKVSNLIYTALLANGGSFFSEGAGNLITTELGAIGLAAALIAFRSQTDEDGEPIDLQPAVLLIPPTLETVGRALLNSIELQRYVAVGTDRQPSGNPFAGMSLSLEVEPRLESANYAGSSETAWYLIAPRTAQAAVVAFLNGQEGGTVEQADVPFDQLGTAWRVYIDVGAALCDPKAVVMSTGSG